MIPTDTEVQKAAKDYSAECYPEKREIAEAGFLACWKWFRAAALLSGEDWISVKEIPENHQDEDQPHLYKLLLLTEEFGQFIGWYAKGKFWTSYAQSLETVTHYMALPEPPKP